jgi:hypothetical protein
MSHTTLRALAALALSVSVAACGGSDDQAAIGEGEGELTALTGAFWLEPTGHAPTDDMVFAIEFGATKKVRVLSGYMGNTYIERGCVTTYAWGGQGTKRTLDIGCPGESRPTSYPVISTSADAIVLATPKKGTQYTLRSTRGVKGAPRLTCTSAKFSATIDVVGSGSSRRMLLSTTAIKPPKGAENGALFNVPRDESLWIESNGKGHDLGDNDYVLSLPAALGPHVSATLTYTDQLQYYPQPTKYPLSCVPASP